MCNSIVYLLQHSYDYGENSEYTETKVIGIYSSKEIAESVVETYKNLPGFNEFDVTCFYIDEYILDDSEWKFGFENK
jgi:hypothetical protein